MSRIRHATESFVNTLVEGVQKLIATNTEQISILSTDRGYLQSKETSDLDLQKSNGISSFPSSALNKPTSSQGEMITIKRNDAVFGQIALTQDDKMAYRTYNVNAYNAWKQLATTDKVDILFPYNSATFSPVDSYFPNKCISSDAKKELYIWLKMTDNTKFKAGTYYIVGTIPVGYRPTSNMAGICSCKNRNEGIKQYQASYEIFSGTGVVYVAPTVDCDNLLLQEVF